MGRLNPNDFPKNVRDIVNETKPIILDKMSRLINQNNNLCSIVKTDESKLPETVWNLTTKTKQELLEIIARKDDVELQQQNSIKQHIAEINKLYNDYKNLKYINSQTVNDYKKAETMLCIAAIVWVITIIAYFVI